MSESITFVSEIIKVQQMANTMAVRVTLDLPETCTMQMAQLAEAKRQGAVLEIEAIPKIPEKGGGKPIY